MVLSPALSNVHAPEDVCESYWWAAELRRFYSAVLGEPPYVSCMQQNHGPISSFKHRSQMYTGTLKLAKKSAWWHQANIWTKKGVSSMESCGLHLKYISQECLGANINQMYLNDND